MDEKIDAGLSRFVSEAVDGLPKAAALLALVTYRSGPSTTTMLPVDEIREHLHSNDWRVGVAATWALSRGTDYWLTADTADGDLPSVLGHLRRALESEDDLFTPFALRAAYVLGHRCRPLEAAIAHRVLEELATEKRGSVPPQVQALGWRVASWALTRPGAREVIEQMGRSDDELVIHLQSRETLPGG